MILKLMMNVFQIGYICFVCFKQSASLCSVPWQYKWELHTEVRQLKFQLSSCLLEVYLPGARTWSALLCKIWWTCICFTKFLKANWICASSPISAYIDWCVFEIPKTTFGWDRFPSSTKNWYKSRHIILWHCSGMGGKEKATPLFLIEWDG